MPMERASGVRVIAVEIRLGAFATTSTTTLTRETEPMGRYLLLWLLGVPVPILLLIWAFGGLH
jgi:hypothetical protein